MGGNFSEVVISLFDDKNYDLWALRMQAVADLNYKSWRDQNNIII